MHGIGYTSIFQISVGRFIIMAKNTGQGHRIGQVDGRSQTYNPKTNDWVKRDTSSGQFIDRKTSTNSPFKGVRKED